MCSRTILEPTPTSIQTAGVDNQWYEVNNYLMYKVATACRTAAGGMVPGSARARVVAGDAGNYVSLTAGVNWRPHSNVTIRPENSLRRVQWHGRPGGSAFQRRCRQQPIVRWLRRHLHVLAASWRAEPIDSLAGQIGESRIAMGANGRCWTWQDRA